MGKLKMLDNKVYIKKFTKMQKVTIQVTRKVAREIKPGMSERDIAKLYTKKLAKFGLEEHWYPIQVHVGEMTAIPVSRKHHLPSTKITVKEDDIIILDCTPFDKTVWSNWAETFLIGKNNFFKSLIGDVRSVVNETYIFAKTKAKTVGDIFVYCNSRIDEYGLKSLDANNNLGHSIFQVPEGQTVDKTPKSERLFVNEEYKESPVLGIISIEVQLGRVNPDDGKMYGAKIQKIIIK